MKALTSMHSPRWNFHVTSDLSSKTSGGVGILMHSASVTQRRFRYCCVREKRLTILDLGGLSVHSMAATELMGIN